MKEELNIAKILLNKPMGTFLHSDVFGSCEFYGVEESDMVRVMSKKHVLGKMYSGTEAYLPNGKMCDEGKCVLFPSDKMRDWSKFAWTTGTLLVSNDKKSYCLFLGWNDDNYDSFNASYYVNYDENHEVKDYMVASDVLMTSDYTKDKEENRKTYIETIEGLFGGKFNENTLELEDITRKVFEAGDVLALKIRAKKYIFIFENINQADDKRDYDEFKTYALYVVDAKHLGYGDFFYMHRDGYIRHATDDEKKTLWEAMKSDGKRWNPKTKKVEEIGQKVQKFYAYQQVLVRNSDASCWVADLFSHFDDTKENLAKFRTVCGWYTQCISYSGHEELLGTNKKVEG